LLHMVGRSASDRRNFYRHDDHEFAALFPATARDEVHGACPHQRKLLLHSGSQQTLALYP
jgi:hypothetical protein